MKYFKIRKIRVVVHVVILRFGLVVACWDGHGDVQMPRHTEVSYEKQV